MVGHSVERDRMTESDDRLLLREFTHRTGNDYAAALAAMRLASRGTGPKARARLVEEAICRLEASAAVHLLLAAPVRRQVDVGAALRELCRNLVDARPAAARSRVFVDAGELMVDGDLARRVALITAELVVNAVRHALEGRAGALSVRLERAEGDLRLVVADDGAGMRPGGNTSGTGWGGGLVAELVARGAGSLSVDGSVAGTIVEVRLPIRPAADEASDFAF